MNKLILMTLSLVTSLATQASPTCHGKMQKSDILKIVKELIEKDMPILNEAFNTGRIRYRENTGDEYFFATFPVIKDIITFRKKKRFYLKVNKSIYDCPPPMDALKAILVHELKHLSDYETGNFVSSIGLAGSYTSIRSQSKYERETDLYTMEKGHAEGVSSYRKWVYERLDKKALAKKRCIYITPEEIKYWQETGEYKSKEYFNTYCPQFKTKKKNSGHPSSRRRVRVKSSD